LVTKSSTQVSGIQGGLATWQDSSDARWILAPVWGSKSGELKYSSANGEASHGFIAAFKVQDSNGNPVLIPEWTSRDMIAPTSIAIIHGVVFALANGESNGTHAVLYALDSGTGTELHSSGASIGSSSHGGLSAANGFVYVTGNDGVLYCFGIPQEH